jgi:hypothetical protein
VLARLFDPGLLAIVGCWFIASAILDYLTPRDFHFLYCLAVLAPVALLWGWRVWACRRSE